MTYDFGTRRRSRRRTLGYYALTGFGQATGTLLALCVIAAIAYGIVRAVMP